MQNNLHTVIPEKMQSMTNAEVKKAKIYPTFQMDSEDLPELKNWKVGEKYMLVMEVEQMAMRQGKEWQGSNEKDNKVYATFKVMKVGVEEKDFEREYANKRSGKDQY